MMKKTILILFVLFFTLNVFGQMEYFVRVDPSTCGITIIDSIPLIHLVEIASATSDKINKRYVFVGLLNSGSTRYLCSIDQATGNTLSIPAMTGNFGCLKFDNSTGILYGLHWTSSVSSADFVSIDPATLACTVISTLSFSGLSNDVTFDDINHRYILLALDPSGTLRLYSIDAATGNIISQPALTGFSGIQFDNSSGILYGLHWDNSVSTEYFDRADPVTGALTAINSIPGIGSIAMGYPTFDEINKRYTFYGIGTSPYLVTLDATTGSVVTNPPFITFVSPYNLIETEYDNSTGILYGLHWGASDELSGIGDNFKKIKNLSIFPNPASSTFMIESDIAGKYLMKIFDVSGREVYSRNINNNEEVDISALDQGIYIVKANTTMGPVNSRLVVTH